MSTVNLWSACGNSTGNSLFPIDTNINTMNAATKDKTQHNKKSRSSKSNSKSSSLASRIAKVRVEKIRSSKSSSTTSGIRHAGSTEGSYRRPEYMSPIADGELDSIVFQLDKLEVNRSKEGGARRKGLKAYVESSLDINDPNGDNNLQDLKENLESRIHDRELVMKYKKEKQEKFRASLVKMDNCHKGLHIKYKLIKEELKAANRKIKALEAALATYKSEVNNRKHGLVTSVDSQPFIKHSMSDTESMLRQNGSEDKMMTRNKHHVPSNSSKLSDNTQLPKYEQDLIKMCLEWTNSSSARNESLSQLPKMSATRPSSATQTSNTLKHVVKKELTPLNSDHLSTDDHNVGSRNPHFTRSLSLQIRANGHSSKSYASQKKSGIPESRFRPSLSSQKEISDTDSLFKPSVSSPKITKVSEPLFKQAPFSPKVPSVDDNLSSQHRLNITVPQLKQSLASLKKTKCGDPQFRKSLPAETTVHRYNTRRGIPVANRHFQHSLSTGAGDKWVYHAPPKLVPMGTVMKPVVPDSKAVKKLPKFKDIIDSRTSKYCLIAQEQDTDGELETKLYKGNVVPTCGGGAQVIFDDVEMLKQSSPHVGRNVSSDVAKKSKY